MTPNRIEEPRAPQRKQQSAAVLALVLAAAGILCFILVAQNVANQHTQRFDESVLRSLRRSDNLAVPVGPVWMAQAARDITALGSLSVLSLVTAGAAGLLAIARKRSAMWFLLAAVGSGALLAVTLKACFDRPRPSLVPHLDVVASPSFPSGHSMLSAIVYLTAGVLAAHVAGSRRARLYMLLVAAVITLLVGFSRMVLGVHYPTDVLAGWIGGVVWALTCWLVAKSIQGVAAAREATDGA
jgi:undecaprenyl-diphosphatase